MLDSIPSLSSFVIGAGKVLLSIGLKPIKAYIDSHFRSKVTPIAGSVVYCDLWVLAEHSGIYVENGQISNIVVTDFAESEVKYSNASDFTSKSTAHRKIYVSSNQYGAVGDSVVANGAVKHIGEQNFYGLVFKNCHQFSSKCVNYAQHNPTIKKRLLNSLNNILDLEWEGTIRQLKFDASQKLGATKWLLWDWDGKQEEEPEPDWDQQKDFFKEQVLSPKFIKMIHKELSDIEDYQAEISDENIPTSILDNLADFQQELKNIDQAYQQAEDFLELCSDAGLSFNDLKEMNGDFSSLAQQLQSNVQIKNLVEKLGRSYQSEEHRKRKRVPSINKDEVHGTHRSDDIMRLLPNELVNFEDETLEVLFYARLLEKNLLSYELQGKEWNNEDDQKDTKQRTGPVVACVDTSGSMEGQPLLKAKALLIAIANILKQEQRSLHVILFGDRGQTQEYTLNDSGGIPELLRFLNKGFGGGTDFETPLNKALEIIEQHQDYNKADILMISDGACTVSTEFVHSFQLKKLALDCQVYTVLCAMSLEQEDQFSDETVFI